MIGAVSDWLWVFGLELWDLLLFASRGHGDVKRCGEGGDGLHPRTKMIMLPRKSLDCGWWSEHDPCNI